MTPTSLSSVYDHCFAFFKMAISTILTCLKCAKTLFVVSTNCRALKIVYPYKSLKVRLSRMRGTEFIRNAHFCVKIGFAQLGRSIKQCPLSAEESVTLLIFQGCVYQWDLMTKSFTAPICCDPAVNVTIPWRLFLN